MGVGDDEPVAVAVGDGLGDVEPAGAAGELQLTEGKSKIEKTPKIASATMVHTTALMPCSFGKNRNAAAAAQRQTATSSSNPGLAARSTRSTAAGVGVPVMANPSFHCAPVRARFDRPVSRHRAHLETPRRGLAAPRWAMAGATPRPGLP